MELSVDFWIDAICINQSDVQERNEQVQLMSTMYIMAQYVLIWSKDCREPDAREADVRSGLLNYSGALQSPSNRKKLLEHLHGPYWDRLWMVPELTLARECFILHEPFMSKWDDVKASGIDIFEAADSCTYLMESVSSRVIQLLYSFGGNNGRLWRTAQSVLGVCSNRQCLDLRDKWYAILGMIPGGKKFPVDYSVTVRELVANLINWLKIDEIAPQELRMLLRSLVEYFPCGAYILCRTCAGRPGQQLDFSWPAIINSHDPDELFAIVMTDTAIPLGWDLRFKWQDLDSIYAFRHCQGYTMSVTNMRYRSCNTSVSPRHCLEPCAVD